MSTQANFLFAEWSESGTRGRKHPSGSWARTPNSNACIENATTRSLSTVPHSQFRPKFCRSTEPHHPREGPLGLVLKAHTTAQVFGLLAITCQRKPKRIAFSTLCDIDPVYSLESSIDPGLRDTDRADPSKWIAGWRSIRSRAVSCRGRSLSSGRSCEHDKKYASIIICALLKKQCPPRRHSDRRSRSGKTGHNAAAPGRRGETHHATDVRGRAGAAGLRVHWRQSTTRPSPSAPGLRASTRSPPSFCTVWHSSHRRQFRGHLVKQEANGGGRSAPARLSVRHILPHPRLPRGWGEGRVMGWTRARTEVAFDTMSLLSAGVYSRDGQPVARSALKFRRDERRRSSTNPVKRASVGVGAREERDGTWARRSSSRSSIAPIGADCCCDRIQLVPCMARNATRGTPDFDGTATETIAQSPTKTTRPQQSVDYVNGRVFKQRQGSGRSCASLCWRMCPLSATLRREPPDLGLPSTKKLTSCVTQKPSPNQEM